MRAATVVPDLLAARRADAPGDVALVVAGGPALTNAEWDERAWRLAGGLAARGVARGDRVALIFDNSGWIDYAVAYLGVLAAGAVAVPVGTRFASAELMGVLAHCQASGIISMPEVELPGGLPGWRATAPELEAGPSPVSPSQAPKPGDLAEVLYTSGTTGVPKGVACTHASLMFHELPGAVAAPRRASFLHAFPVGTNAGQEALRLPLRLGGRTAVALPSFEPWAWCAAVERYQVAGAQLVPAMAQAIVSSGAAGHHDVSSLRRITLSSAPAAPRLLADLAAAFPMASVANAYALTESGTARTLADHADRHPGSVGRPVGGTEVRVVDESGADLASGALGEIWLAHPDAPPRSYYRDPGATAAAWSGGWLHTGDLGHLDPSGRLYLVDRKKDLIISGGSNVSSLEVEAVLAEHPAVAEVAVFGVPHDLLGQDVAAAVVARRPVRPRELQDFVRRRLAEHKVPHRVAFVEDLPRTASGKVRKADLAAEVAWSPLPAGAGEGAEAPATPVQAAVAGVWEEVLARPSVGVHDDFFDLGGQSLAAAQVVARLRDRLGVELPVAAVFDAPTVAELAEAVEAARA